MPDVKESVSSMNVRKAYIPFWYYDMAISADITPASSTDESPEALVKGMGKQRQMLGITFDSFWPGHTWDPVCYLSFGHSLTTRLEKLVPFTPDLYADADIEVLPFSVDPIKDITNRASSALENLKVESMTHKNGYYTVNNANVLFNAVYPIYWPVYVAQFTDSDEPPKTVVIGAHSDDPPVYQWDPKKKGVEQWVNNGPWVKADVTEADWQMGFANQTPMVKLVQKFVTEATQQFETNTIDWEDARVQSYANYTQQNKDYLKQLYKVWAERSMLSRIENMGEDQKTIGIRRSSDEERKGITPRLQVKTVREIRQDIEDRVAGELTKLEELEPTWFKEYNKQKNE
jgi:hypothetical protein